MGHVDTIWILLASERRNAQNMRAKRENGMRNQETAGATVKRMFSNVK